MTITMLSDKSATLKTVNSPERSMDCDQVWAWVQQKLRPIDQGSCDDLIREVFYHAWEKQTYEDMATSLGYSADHLRAKGSELFKHLSQLLGETINKNNFKPRLLEHVSRSTPTFTTQLPPQQDHRFLGRDRDVAALKSLADNGTKIILIQGLGGAGKTTLARKYFESQGITTVLEIWIPIEGQVTSAEVWVAEWLRGVFDAEVGADFGINLDRLKLCLRKQTKPIGILIDNLETILNGRGQIVPEHRRYVELLRTLSNADLPILTLITSREDLCEAQIDPESYRLNGLDEASWQAYFTLQNIHHSPTTRHQVWTATNGNPKAMKILAGAARSDFDKNLDAYWASANQDILFEGELQALVEQQFQRLALTQPEAYQLLCRLGVYRYQDVPNVSLQGVLALLELPEAAARQALHILKDRSLIDSRRNEIFWLHPMIRTESIKQLKAQGQWENINRRAGEIWQTMVPQVATVEDALQAMEAYYHFVEIGDYDLACEVIWTQKETSGGDSIALGWLLYRLSLLRQILSATETLIAHLPPNDRTGRLYNLQGYIHRLGGHVHRALKCHHEAQKIEPAADLPQLQISSWLHIGLCQRDLWDLDQAQYAFEMALQIAEASDSKQYVIYTRCCLAYIHSHRGDRDRAKAFLAQINQIHLRQQVTAWGNGYSLLFLAHTYRKIGAWDAALEIFYETLNHAQSHQFAQIRGKVFNGLAQTYRDLGDLPQALTCHDEALGILEPLGANCIVAEALTQRSVTYRALGCHEASDVDLNLAQQLFQAIPAPDRMLWIRQQFQ